MPLRVVKVWRFKIWKQFGTFEHILFIAWRWESIFKCSESHREPFGKRQLMREGGGEVAQRDLEGSGNYSTIALFIITHYQKGKNRIAKHSSWKINCAACLLSVITWTTFSVCVSVQIPHLNTIGDLLRDTMISPWEWGKRRQKQRKETARKPGQGQKYVKWRK